MEGEDGEGRERGGGTREGGDAESEYVEVLHYNVDGLTGMHQPTQFQA